MAERPTTPESLAEKFNKVMTVDQLVAAVKEIPNTETFLLADEVRGQNVAPGDKEALNRLLQAIFECAQNSSLRRGIDQAARVKFLDELIGESIIDDGGDSVYLIRAIRRAIIDEFPEYAGPGVAATVTTGAPTVPEAATEFAVTPEMREALLALNYPLAVIDSITAERAEELLVDGRPYMKPRVKTAAPGAAPVVPAAVPLPTVPPVPPPPAPANLAKLMAKKTEIATTNTVAAGTAAPAVAVSSPESISKVFDDNPEFRTFFAKADKAEQLVREQNLAEIETYRRAFTIKDKLAADLYELANAAIKGDFLLDFENPDSNLPKNQRVEFQRYVDGEALSRPEQLLNLAFQLETRQVLEKNIATAKADIERLGGKDFFDEAEREAVELKQHLERAHESTRRDSIAGYIPHGLHLGFLRTLYQVNERVGWKGQTEGSVKSDFEQKRAKLLSGRLEADLSPKERSDLRELVQGEVEKLAALKRHQVLGERMVEVSQQGVSREALKGNGVNLGFGSLLSYSPLWISHPEIARELETVNARLEGIRQRKQTIEQAEQSLAAITQSFETMRTSAYRELPPTITLVKYAQAQIKNTLTSFTADTAVEDLQRIYEYILLLDNRASSGSDTGAEPFEQLANIVQVADTLHEAIVAQWGKRIFEVFEKTALNKKGAIAEMEKSVKDILKLEAIGAVSRESLKAGVVKKLLTEAFKKIDPAKGDGKERRMALMGVMISCGLLKPGEVLPTA